MNSHLSPWKLQPPVTAALGACGKTTSGKRNRMNRHDQHALRALLTHHFNVFLSQILTTHSLSIQKKCSIRLGFVRSSVTEPGSIQSKQRTTLEGHRKTAYQ